MENNVPVDPSLTSRVCPMKLRDNMQYLCVNNSDFVIEKKYKFLKALGQGAYGIVM
jgi:hypothetical protein